MAILLRVKHVELVEVAVEPGGALLAVCIQEAIYSEQSADDSVPVRVNVRRVELPVLVRKLVPFLDPVVAALASLAMHKGHDHDVVDDRVA